MKKGYGSMRCDGRFVERTTGRLPTIKPQPLPPQRQGLHIIGVFGEGSGATGRGAISIFD